MIPLVSEVMTLKVRDGCALLEPALQSPIMNLKKYFCSGIRKVES